MRDQIMLAVENRLRDILQINGYNTNLGSNVFPWELADIPDTSRPAVTCRDVSREIIQHVASHMHKLTIELEMFPLSTDAAPADSIRLFIQDVVNAIGTDTTWGGLAITAHVIGDAFIVTDPLTSPPAPAIKSGMITMVITYRGEEFSE